MGKNLENAKPGDYMVFEDNRGVFVAKVVEIAGTWVDAITLKDEGSREIIYPPYTILRKAAVTEIINFQNCIPLGDA